jgi:hypothetical protein
MELGLLTLCAVALSLDALPGQVHGGAVWGLGVSFVAAAGATGQLAMRRSPPSSPAPASAK